MIYSREYARPSPTDMPYSQRDILNKKESMKNYIKALKSFKVAPRLLSNETEGFGHLLIEDENIRIPASPHGLSEVTKMYLDQNKLRRYLQILDMELQRTPATIELDSSKIIDYIKMLNTLNKHEGKSADLVSRSRIKLMKGGITENIMYDEKGRQQEPDFYGDDYVDKRDAKGIENMNDESIYSTADKNGFYFDSDIADKKPEEVFNEDSDFQKSVNPDFDYSKTANDIAVNEYVENENYDLNSDSGNQLLDTNIKKPDNEKIIIPENIASNIFTRGENYNNDAEPSDDEWIENAQVQNQPSSASEYFGLESARRLGSDPEKPPGNNEKLELSNKVGAENNNEKSELNDWSYKDEKSKDQSLFDSPFDVPVPINHVISKDSGVRDEKRANINGKRDVKRREPKPEQRMRPDGMSYDNAKRLELTGGVNIGGLEKYINPGHFGSILTNLQNKLLNMDKSVKVNQVADTTINVSSLYNQSFSQQFLKNLYDNIDVRKAIEIKAAAFFNNISGQNFSSSEPSSNSDFTSNGPLDHRIFPLKPEDEIVNVPKVKYFEQCFNHYQDSKGMPTKPPKMFSKFYISKLKKFSKYDGDSGSLNFLKKPRLPLFGTKESEVSKILNVNLDHLHIDKGALYKIIGKALKIDEENTQDYVPPKWLEDKYDELLHASHRGQNCNDYDFVEKSRHNMILSDRFNNIRDRKESVFERNSTRI